MDATSLPATCGEATGVPGVPCVGCVAVLPCGADTAGGFACAVVGSHADVFLLGPDLRRRDGSVASARLWRAPPGARPARVTALAAFARPSPQSAGGLRGVAAPDTACAVVAWEDAEEPRGRVGALFFSPRRALEAPEAAAAVMRETGFAQDRGPLRVLRLFYHPMFSADAQAAGIVVCSCYDETPRREAREAQGEGRDAFIPQLGDPRDTLTGHISFVRCAATTGEKGTPSQEAYCAEWHKEATPAVAPWLADCKCEGVVCAVAVQGMTSHVVAALGTVNGRLILLYRDGNRVVYRVGGPVADLAFASTRCVPGEERYQNAAVNEVLEGDRRLRASTNASFCVTPDSNILDISDDLFMCLVVLDSIGRVVILRAVNSGAPILQIVSDIRQYITLAGRRAPCQSTTSVLEEAMGSRPVSMSSKNFLGLSSLLMFFQRKRQKDPRAGLKETSATHQVKGEPEVSRRTLREETHAAGNILSRGLLCLALTVSPRGRVELVVSTMGQCIVSIPFDTVDGTFSVAGFIAVPNPMFFVGFVDFFNTGVPELVMAGSHHVLVAKRSRRHQIHRASILLRLLAEQQRTENKPTQSVMT